MGPRDGGGGKASNLGAALRKEPEGGACMLKVDVCNDLEKAEGLWRRYWPQNCLFDLWPVRACFQDQYHNEPHFIVASRGRRVRGLLALSRIEETQCYGHFPGELWQGKTWLEQNKIVAANPATARSLLDHMPAGTRLRYLDCDDRLGITPWAALDETGYLFYPRQFNNSFDAYWGAFSGKSRKKIRGEINRLTAGGVAFRYDRPADVDWMLRLNLERYGHLSYFNDVRFLRAFEKLAAWLLANDLLRVTTVLIGGRIAAVDMGAVWNNTYTVLAGGTHADFPGVAKLINLHHLEWACAQEISVVDFLCGEFNWKDRFHLTPRRLYQMWQPQIRKSQHAPIIWNRPAAFAV
jgi:hypothetical protein